MTTYLHAEALAVSGNDPDSLQSLLQNPSEWHAAVRQHCALLVVFSSTDGTLIYACSRCYAYTSDFKGLP